MTQQRPLANLCVFCGSNPGTHPDYVAVACQLGAAMVERDIGLVYGGGRTGIMGAVSESVVAHGGRVVGVIPEALTDREVAYTELDDLRIVGSMHERKATMAVLADAFVALPGGLGTLEELFEVWTWAQLGYHRKSVAVLNIHGYWDGLLQFVAHGVDQGFIKPPHRDILVVADTVAGLFEGIEGFVPPELPQWLKHDEL